MRLGLCYCNRSRIYIHAVYRRYRNGEVQPVIPWKSDGSADRRMYRWLNRAVVND